MPFSHFNLHSDLVRAITTLGFKSPTPIQAQAIPPALEGKDILGCAQTGSGKTVAFALPVLHHLLTHPGDGLRALILVPTRELASQVERTFRDCGRYTSFKTAVIIGGVSHTMQMRAVQKGANILVATPGRLLDHLRQGNFTLKYLEQLVLDEADRMLDMGFLPDIKEVLKHAPVKRQTQLFSATLHEDVERIAAFATSEPLRVEIARPSTVAEGISQILYPVIQSQKAGLLLTLLKSTEMRSVLVFSRTKHGADKIAGRLQDEGYKVGTLHSNRSQNQRQKAMDDFRQMRTQILVATDIAARGIDVKNISHVVNFDVPRFPEDYVHRVGRTARAYGVGDAILMMDPMEGSFVKAIERFIQVTFPRATIPGFQYNKPPKHGPRPPQHHRPKEGQSFGNKPRSNEGGPSSPPTKRPNVGYAFRNKFKSGGPSFGNRPPKSGGGDQPFRNKFKSRDGGKPFNKYPRSGDAPSDRKPFNRPPRDESFGNREPRPNGGVIKSFFNKFKRRDGGQTFGNKPPRSSGESSHGSKFNRPPRDESFGNREPRPSGGKSFGTKFKPRGGGQSFGSKNPRSGGGSSYGNSFNRPPRDDSFGNREPRPSAGGQSFGNKFKRRDGGSSFGNKHQRPNKGGSFGQKPKGPSSFRNNFRGK
jgi:ATP-dependent RNA helicase RhlE